MASSPQPPLSQTLNLTTVLSESKRIINAHSRHFLALSVLFLLPLSFSLIIYPTLSSALYHHHSNLITTQFFFSSSSPSTTEGPHPYLLPVIFTLLTSLLSLLAIATITFSTLHAFFGRPVKLISSIYSLFHNFFPLLSTALASQFILLAFCAALVLFIGLTVKGVETLGFRIDYDSIYTKVSFLVLLIVLDSLMVYFLVNWSLAPAIVIAESKWGFEPLRRSAYLVKGMRSVSLSVLLFFGVSIGFLIWGNSYMSITTSFGWRSWVFVLQIVLGSSIITLLLLHNAAANAVLYMYCKALHGELAFEIAEEFAREYVSLPFDDEKVPHVVTVV